MLNNVSLVGRLTKDPEVKTIGEGTAVCNFTLAVNRPYKNKDGENEADFIQCQAWNKQAEFIGSYLTKGQLIGVTGAINTRSYEKDGQTHYVTEVNLNSVQSLERKEESNAGTETEASIKKEWEAEWAKRSVGLDAAAKKTLKEDLRKKYQPRINKLEMTKNSDLPY